jgi:hypothetical protein
LGYLSIGKNDMVQGELPGIKNFSFPGRIAWRAEFQNIFLGKRVQFGTKEEAACR